MTPGSPLRFRWKTKPFRHPVITKGISRKAASATITSSCVPSTGTPAGEVHSVTIIGPDAVITDALSTSVFIMGVEQGLTLISTLPDYEGIVIDASGQMFYSTGLQPPE